jgi:hypothetical protein
MDEMLIRDGLVAMLTQCYEANPGRFVTLPKQLMDSSFARVTIADLRNDGYVEEETRGVVRLTHVGYSQYKKRGKAAFGELGFQLAV